jgi:hypothetical protein
MTESDLIRTLQWEAEGNTQEDPDRLEIRRLEMSPQASRIEEQPSPDVPTRQPGNGASPENTIQPGAEVPHQAGAQNPQSEYRSITRIT